MSFVDRLMDHTFLGLNRALDLTWRRNEAITSNIANTETPLYRAVDLDFGHELDRAFGVSAEPLTTTNEKHLDVTSNSGSHLISDLRGMTKPDGNNVDIDIQMGQLAYNSQQYSQAADLMKKKLSMLKGAVREGAR